MKVENNMRLKKTRDFIDDIIILNLGVAKPLTSHNKRTGHIGFHNEILYKPNPNSTDTLRSPIFYTPQQAFHLLYRGNKLRK